jgi:hypothetical protein
MHDAETSMAARNISGKLVCQSQNQVAFREARYQYQIVRLPCRVASRHEIEADWLAMVIELSIKSIFGDCMCCLGTFNEG